ncbi:ATP-binding cassette domain-containing protein [Glaciecola sp. 2405UD65-10]|uniref:ATP-binding cassette domain-containing protein n=1 Tax=Glaciecola sp. 2405UD65-10 TaxID=3397244 RepID=UPI003B5908BD
MTLTLNKVSVLRFKQPLLNIDTVINAGEVLSIMGPSGSGKSTLLNAIAGQLSAPFSQTGSIYINNECIDHLPAFSRGVGVLYQDPLLFEHMSVGQNIAFAIPTTPGFSKRLRNQKVREMLEQVGLEDLHDRPVQTLSGGQQARIALLRTLAASPKVVLLDEPFSKLDTATKTHMRKWVFEQLKASGIPTVLVTHDINDTQAAQGHLIEIQTC